MREIKFRAWNTTFQQYYYSDTIGLEGFFERYQCWSDFKEAEQYTGLKDKKGDRIYEGDIVLLPNNCRCAKGCGCKNNSIPVVVKWNDRLARYEMGDFGYMFCPESNLYLEIIGNVNKNPELINGGN